MSKKLTYEQLEEKVTELEKENKLLKAKVSSLIFRHKSKSAERKTDFRITQLSNALDKLSTYVFIKDTEGRYLYANNQTLKLFNLTEDDVFGKVDSQFQNAGTAEQIKEIDKRVLLHGEDTEREISFLLPDGSERIYRELKTPIYDNIKQNEIIGLCGISTDITEIKKSENLLKENETKLKEFNATKDKFFSIIAHDLRSPFNNILGLTQLLAMHIQNKDFEAMEKYTNLIRESTERGLTLLTGLFQWAQSQTGKMKFRPKNFDVSNLIKEIAEIKTTYASQKNIQISYETSTNIRISADEEMVRTVLRNLVYNAIKFTNSGGKIHITAEQNEDEITMAVIDNGVGMEESTVNKLFRIEEDVSTTGTNNEKGTGLGLILCKEFVGMHNGKIWANSVKGKGSEFRFTLPVHIA